MIRINHHGTTPRGHRSNTGLGNKLFLNFLARALSIENNEPMQNWMRTKIYAGNEEDYDGIHTDRWDFEWPYINHNERELTTVGIGENCEYGDYYHQNKKTIDLISKYKQELISDFGKTDGLFVHVRWGDLAGKKMWSSIPNYEYYDKCLSDTPYKKGYLASDTFDHPFIQKLLNRFNLEFYKASPEETIIFGSTFSDKILSFGSFSWWVGFIGNQNNVIYPHPDGYSTNGDIFKCMTEWKAGRRPYEKNN